MYLKSIEVHGFKSFANKIVFKFNSGITGIVGPNGSGKSNVADAVRWVLGEQSAKQLRGGNMQDVIFSGTQLRKPLGFAYVAITLDNSDHKLPLEYDEVTVARRVYRSGESEYLVNGNQCRLKDVQELFFDTGIGKEGYSIIGQGQIDRILSGKPEERRELFDEAAGIVKYKKRKLSAQKDLETERLNLSRVTDILSELNGQIEPLKAQSDTAREYLKLKEELKLAEVSQFLYDYETNASNKEELNKKLEIAVSDISTAKSELENTKEQYESIEKELEEKNQAIESAKNEKNDIILSTEREKNEIGILNEQILAAEQTKKHFAERIENIKNETASRREDIKKYELEIADNEERVKKLTVDNFLSSTLEEVREKIRLFTEESSECNKGIINALNEDTKIQSEMSRLKAISEQNSIRKASLNKELIIGKSEEAAYIKAADKYSEELDKLQKDALKYKGEAEVIQSSINKCMQKTKQMSLDFSKKQQEYAAANAKLESFKNISERYEGYNNSVRRVMEQKSVTPGILGVVADLIHVKKDYELAVETAIGGNIQNIVTDNDITAKELIGFLKRNKFGRATFLPLTNLTSSVFNNSNVLKEKGVIGLASSLVKFDAEYEKLVEYLLGRIIVLDNIDNALELAKKYNHSFRIVTLEGDQINPGGSMSGGAFRNSGNLLGRNREIDELTKMVSMLKEEFNKINKEQKEIEEEKAALTNTLEDINKKLQSVYMAQNTVKLKLEQENNKLLNIKENFNGLLAEIQKLEFSAADLDRNIEEFNKKTEENNIIAAKNKVRIAECESAVEELKKDEERLNEANAKNILELSKLNTEKAFNNENLERLKSELSKLEIEENEVSENLIFSEKARSEKLLVIKNKEQLILSLEEELEKKTKAIEMLISKKEELNASHKGFFERREELTDRAAALDKEEYRLKAQLERINEYLEGQITYMWEEYELTVSAALKYKDDNVLIPVACKSKIVSLKNDIKKLGDVNVNAIEDYKNVSERHSFLSAQYEDLKLSEEKLIKIIEELDILMRKQFAEKFEDIKAEFDIVFKELFGGGKGNLELVEDEDILEAGIKIIAQPPGKKLQNMMQLSGGEKALTAISLLFAIQNLKPSPFCLLDEIEAALDDSNVKRYATYLHKLTKYTQFIVITHRRGTMGAADVLYGITMQEKGVSTLVSVNLIEDKLDA